MNKTIIRVYTGIVKTIRKPDRESKERDCYEFAYKEYDIKTRELVAEGTENFTGKRMCDELRQYEILLRDDVRNHVTDPCRWIFVNKNQDYAAIMAQLVYGEEALRVKRIH